MLHTSIIENILMIECDLIFQIWKDNLVYD